MAKTAIFSWDFDLFLTFVIDCSIIYVPNRYFWGPTSRPGIGDLVMSLIFTLGSTVHDKQSSSNILPLDQQFSKEYFKGTSKEWFILTSKEYSKESILSFSKEYLILTSEEYSIVSTSKKYFIATNIVAWRAIAHDTHVYLAGSTCACHLLCSNCWQSETKNVKIA